MFFSKALTFLKDKGNEQLIKAIRENEKGTSGEIRLFIESKCAYVNPLDRAKELFLQLKMYETEHRNAVLIYIAYHDKDFALFCDQGLNHKVEVSFWNTQSKNLAIAFHQQLFVDGMKNCISQVGSELRKHFPYHGEEKNELPDEIIFGK